MIGSYGTGARDDTYVVPEKLIADAGTMSEDLVTWSSSVTCIYETVGELKEKWHGAYCTIVVQPLEDIQTDMVDYGNCLREIASTLGTAGLMYQKLNTDGGGTVEELEAVRGSETEVGGTDENDTAFSFSDCQRRHDEIEAARGEMLKVFSDVESIVGALPNIYKDEEGTKLIDDLTRITENAGTYDKIIGKFARDLVEVVAPNFVAVSTYVSEKDKKAV